MQIQIPDNCGNSPRSLLAIEVAINFASNKYSELEPLLSKDFELSSVGDKAVLRSELESYMERAAQSNVSIEKFKILTSISHGKYAAISSTAHMSDGTTVDSHDLYEFTSTGSSAKLRKVMSYTVGGKQYPGNTIEPGARAHRL